MQHRLARADGSSRRGKLAPCWSLPPCNLEDSSHFRVGEETETSCRQALPGALRVHRLGGVKGLWLQSWGGSSHCTELHLLEGNHNHMILFSLPDPPFSNWHEQNVEVKLSLFPSVKSLITSAVAEMYGEWPFLCPWFPSAVMVGNPGSLTNIETPGKIYKCTQCTHWLVASPSTWQLLQFFWKPALCVPTELGAGTVPAPSPAPCAEPSSLCLTALTEISQSIWSFPWAPQLCTGTHSTLSEQCFYCSWQVQLLFPTLQAKLLPVTRHPKLPGTCQPSAMH